jgi:hypothetical protein
MIKKSIIVILSALPWEWSTDYINQTAFILSKKNVVICLLWNDALSIKECFKKGKIPKLIKKLSKNLYLFEPIHFIPFRRFKLVSEANVIINIFLLNLFVKFLESRAKIERKILWIFHPNLRFFLEVFCRGWKVIYDCVDFFTIGTEEHIEETEINERKLVKIAYLVVANSKVLQKHLKEYRNYVYLVPQGFRHEKFKKAPYKASEIMTNKSIIGFVGAVNYRIDYSLLLKIAASNHQWHFVVWGPVLEKNKFNKSAWRKMKALSSLPNVSTGESKKNLIPGIISQFDIGMIPYDISQDFNKYCYPMKLFEYFYMGKPVVSTPIEELKRFPKFVKIGRTAEEWEKIIKSLLSKSWPEKYKREQKKLAIENSWENKIEAISNVLKKKYTIPS